MTLKYKASGRYDFEEGPIKMNLSRKTGFEDVPTEVLRNLWLVKFGGRSVTLQDMHNHRYDDIADIGQELANRNLIRHEAHGHFDRADVSNYYILEREDGNH
jgi:hypothetical protein